MKEEDLQTLFSRQNAIFGVFELKLTKTKSLAYSKIEPHQIKSLLDANSGSGCAHKLSDMSMDKKPWDCQNIRMSPAYIVVLYYIPRKPKVIYYIPIKSFVATVGPGQGLSEAQAKELAEYTITL
jgi:hypothetical protein